MQIASLRFLRTALLPAGVLAALIGFVLPQGAHAQAALAGKYQCVRVETEGRSATCQSPPLVLKRDGSYDIWGEHGTYEVVQGQWLVLSHSKRRGLGHVKDTGEIVFEYKMDGRTCRVTFRRLFERPPGIWFS